MMRRAIAMVMVLDLVLFSLQSNGYELRGKEPTLVRRINVWYPGEEIALQMTVTNVVIGRDYELRVFDWKNEQVLCRPYDIRSRGRIKFEANELTKYGAYLVQVKERQTSAIASQVRIARIISEKCIPCPWIGTCTHAMWKRPQYADGRFLDMMTVAGIGMVREDFGWRAVEPTTPGIRSIPENYDHYFSELQRRGITWTMLMSWSNPIYKNKLDPDGFAGFCAFTADHFKGRAKWYEIFNEPQNSDFRRVYPHDGRDANSNLIWQVKFCELAQKAAAAIKLADPGARVAVSGEDVQFFLKDLIRLNVAREADAISFHPYCHKQLFPERTYWFSDNGRELRSLAAEHRTNKEFCITEIGWTTFGGEKTTYNAVAGSYPLCGFKRQAQFLTRMYILSRLSGLTFACNYGWIDEGPDQNFTEHNFGQITFNAEPKPAFAATAFLVRFLGHSDVVGEISTTPEKWKLGVFKRNSRRRFVMWSIEGDLIVDYPSQLENARFFDLMGNEMPAPRTNDGRLKLTEAPAYAIEPRR